MTNPLNSTAFYDAIRAPLFDGNLTPDQKAGTDRIILAGDGLDARWLAYILATAYHETGGKMVPQVENLNYSAAGLRKLFPGHFSRAESERYAHKPEGIACRVYANRLGNGDEVSGDGWRYRARGLVMISGKSNYRKFRIATTPDEALVPEVAVRVLIDGMTAGKFAGLKLSDFFNERETDWLGARRIINNNDNAAKIAGYAKVFYAALVTIVKSPSL